MATYVNFENAQNALEKKKPIARRSIDYSGAFARRVYARKTGKSVFLEPDPAYVLDLLPPSEGDDPTSCICGKYIHSSQNKVKHPINVVRWTPDGRRLLTASTSGEFTLWNGMSFNFETIMQAHDSAIRALQWSHSGDWLLSGDQDGTVKYWQPNMNNLKVLHAHSEAVREVAFSPSDGKFISASDDGTLKLWNFNEGVEERTFSGHGWDVKCCDWHPVKGLLVSGSKDNLVKLWDPRTGKCLTTLHGHKNTVQKTIFQPGEGNLLATCSRDQTTRIFDIRVMKDLKVLRGHDKDVTTAEWHPIIPGLISTAAANGSINHYLLDQVPSSVYQMEHSQFNSPSFMLPFHAVPYAHDNAIWTLQYHPLGHLLCSGSNDRFVRFWARPRPWDPDWSKDSYHIGMEAAEALGTSYRSRANIQNEGQDDYDALVDQNMPTARAGPAIPANLQNLVPGLGAYIQAGNPPPPLPPGLGFPGMNGIPGMSQMPFPPPPPQMLPPGQIPPGFVPPPPPGFQPPPMSIPGLGMTNGQKQR